MSFTIEKRGSGWRARVRRGGIEESKTFPSQAAATAWATAVAGAIAGDTYMARTREKATTLRQVLVRYLAEVTPGKKGSRTEEARLRDWMRRPWADLPIISISPAHITEWRDQQLANGKAPSTISNHINTLSHVFKIARAEWGYKVENPVAGIRRPKARKARVAVPNDDLEALLIAAAAESKSSWLAPIIIIAAWSALRQGEFRALQWRDIDFNSRDIHVRDSKNGEERWVTMLPVVEEALRGKLGNRDQKEVENDWIFPAITDTSQPLALYTVTGSFKRLMENVWQAAPDNAKPEKIRFHDLRHWACTRLADYHVDALDLARTTGHKTLQVLMRYYNPSRTSRNARILEKARILDEAKRRGG